MHSSLLEEMGAEGGCNEGNIMVYLGVLEQRANELLTSYLQTSLTSHLQAHTAGWKHGRSPASRRRPVCPPGGS